MDDDRDAALDAARLLVTQYLGQQPHIMKASGVPAELLDEIGEVLTWPATHEQVVAASKLVPDDVVQLITASGTPDECRAKVSEYVKAGLHVPGAVSAGRRRGAHDRRVPRTGRRELGARALEYFWHPGVHARGARGGAPAPARGAAARPAAGDRRRRATG